MSGKIRSTLNTNLGKGGVGLFPGGDPADLPTYLALVGDAADNCNGHGKAPVRLATAAALPSGVYASGVFTVTATGTLTVDSVLTALNDRILVKNQVAGLQNGIFSVTTAGATGVKAVLTRVGDANVSSQMQPGTLVATGPEGSVNPSMLFELTTAAPVTLDTTALTFAALGTSVPNATTGGAGAVQLAGDLGGTATSPSVLKVNGIQMYAVAPVAAISVANQATMTGLAQTVDGVPLSSAGMRVALWSQTTPAQNGIWLTASGAWTRPTDWPTGGTPPLGTVIQVAPGGTTNAVKYGSEWFVVATAVIDTGTVTAYPKVVRGQGAFTSASPSTLSIANAWVLSTSQSVPTAVNMTNAANSAIKAVIAADSVQGNGNGTLVVTGPNTLTDTIGWSVRNA